MIRRDRSRLRALGALGALVAAACLPAGPGVEPWPEPDSLALAPARAEERAACSQRDPLRSAWFGDLHVHTVHSFDANLSGTRGTPDDAYRFAKGHPIGLAPYDASGRGTRRLQLERPLDFAAVTDHAEWIGEVAICTDPDTAGHDSRACRIFRGETTGLMGLVFGEVARTAAIVGVTKRKRSVCGEDAQSCRDALTSVWSDIQDAAERHYDRSAACSFTTFKAWEWSYTPHRSKAHRNVVFRGTSVPELPMSWVDTPTPLELWRKLGRGCLADADCDAIAIPHNPNLSNGVTFVPTYGDEPIEEQRRQARLRAELEPIVEMMQIKGESECRDGLWETAGAPDEWCSFEKRRAPSDPYGDCEDGTGRGGNGLVGCVSRYDYVRPTLAKGLAEHERLGVNPYAFGFIGSTDTHNATPGATDEWSYPGSAGETGEGPAGRLAHRVDRRNPGGLAGVWAEENSRDAIFDALRRRETFATSGTRIKPRLFAGWELPDDFCERRDAVAAGYDGGVPMGGELAAPAGAPSPVFAVSALRDPGTPEHPGGRLERIQIVKGWVGEDGRLHQAVHDVADAGLPRGAVDLATCTPDGAGADALCGVFRDPEFDPAQRAVYYARVLESPSCRWHAYLCLDVPKAERPEVCDDASLPWTVQERAWTSPVWTLPVGTSPAPS